MSTHLSKPAQRLRVAVVLQALDDAAGNIHGKEGRSSRAVARIRQDALDWIRSRSREHPMTFEAICAAFQLNAARARVRLLRRIEVRR